MMSSHWISTDGKFHAELYVGDRATSTDPAWSTFSVRLDSQNMYSPHGEMSTKNLNEIYERAADTITLKDGWIHFVWDRPFEVDGVLDVMYGYGTWSTMEIEGINFEDSTSNGDGDDGGSTSPSPYDNMGLGEDLDGDGVADLFPSDLLTHDSQADPTRYLVGLRGGTDGIKVYGEENAVALLVYDLGGSVYTNGTAKLILDKEVVGYAYGKTIRHIKTPSVWSDTDTPRRATGVIFTNFVWKDEAVMPSETPRTYRFKFEPTILSGSTRSIDEAVSLSSTASSVVNSTSTGGVWVAEPLQSERSRFD